MQTSRVQPPDAGRRRAVVTAVATVLALLLLPASPAWAADPARDRQWALDVIGADTAHAVGQGSGVVIAVVDSGVDLAHEDLADRLVPGRDFVDDDDTPQDEYGHGTHVAGIAAAVGGNGRGIVGTAPAARIMPVRVLDEDGTGSSRDVNDGIRWAADNGADVINLSLGQAAQGIFGSSFTDAVRYAWGRGAVVVVAAGNEFVLSSGFSDEPAVVVSATTREDTKPDYSNGVGQAQWGMAAPGGGCSGLLGSCATEDAVFSTYWVEGRSDRYAYLQGTSMAAPHVAGAAAVLLGLGLEPRAVVDRLLATAEDVGPDGRDSTFGAGRLDLAAAVAGTQTGPTPPSPAPSPTSPAAPASPRPAADDAQPSSAPTAAQTAQPAAPSPPPSPTPTPAPSPTTTPTPTTPAPSAPAATDAPLVAEGDPGTPATEVASGEVLRITAVVLLVAAVGALLAARRETRRG